MGSKAFKQLMSLSDSIGVPPGQLLRAIFQKGYDTLYNGGRPEIAEILQLSRLHRKKPDRKPR